MINWFIKVAEMKLDIYQVDTLQIKGIVDSKK